MPTTERIEAEGEADVRRIVDQPEPMPIPAPAPPPAEVPTQRGPYAAETVTTPTPRRFADLPGQLMMF